VGEFGSDAANIARAFRIAKIYGPFWPLFPVYSIDGSAADDIERNELPELRRTTGR
jgi:hypothetical protein